MRMNTSWKSKTWIEQEEITGGLHLASRLQRMIWGIWLVGYPMRSLHGLWRADLASLAALGLIGQ